MQTSGKSFFCTFFLHFLSNGNLVLKGFLSEWGGDVRIKRGKTRAIENWEGEEEQPEKNGAPSYSLKRGIGLECTAYACIGGGDCCRFHGNGIE